MVKKLLKVLKPMIASFTDPAHFATFRCAPFAYRMMRHEFEDESVPHKMEAEADDDKEIVALAGRSASRGGGGELGS